MIAETIVPIKLKIDWLGNKLWSFEIKVLKFHQKSGHPLIPTVVSVADGLFGIFITIWVLLIWKQHIFHILYPIQRNWREIDQFWSLCSRFYIE